MKTRRHIITIAAFLAMAGVLNAQNFRGGYFLDGYMYAYKLNPASALGSVVMFIPQDKKKNSVDPLNAGLNSYGMSCGAAALVNTDVLQFFVGTDAYVSEMTPQLVPLSKLNHNIVLGLGIPLHKRKL